MKIFLNGKLVIALMVNIEIELSYRPLMKMVIVIILSHVLIMGIHLNTKIQKLLRTLYLMNYLSTEF